MGFFHPVNLRSKAFATLAAVGILVLTAALLAGVRATGTPLPRQRILMLGAGAAGLGSIMTPAQLFVYAIVTSVSVPCVATLAALRGEFGWRPALMMSGASLAIAIAVGGVLARVLGTA